MRMVSEMRFGPIALATSADTPTASDFIARMLIYAAPTSTERPVRESPTAGECSFYEAPQHGASTLARSAPPSTA